MDFFMTYEIDSRYNNFGDILRKIGNDIEVKIKNFLKEKNYGTEIQDLSIIPIIIKFNEQMEKEGWFKEKITYKKSKNQADIRLKINYDKFVNGDEITKKLLLIHIIIKSIRELSKKAKNNFKANELEEDILKLFNLTISDLEKL